MKADPVRKAETDTVSLWAQKAEALRAEFEHLRLCRDRGELRPRLLAALAGRADCGISPSAVAVPCCGAGVFIRGMGAQTHLPQPDDPQLGFREGGNGVVAKCFTYFL